MDETLALVEICYINSFLMIDALFFKLGIRGWRLTSDHWKIELRDLFLVLLMHIPIGYSKREQRVTYISTVDPLRSFNFEILLHCWLLWNSLRNWLILIGLLSGSQHLFMSLLLLLHLLQQLSLLFLLLVKSSQDLFHLSFASFAFLGECHILLSNQLPQLCHLVFIDLS